MLLFDEEFMFLKRKQDFAKEREKKINAATERKKMGTGHGRKKKEKFSDLFSRDLCLLHAECCICQYAKGMQAEAENALLCPPAEPSHWEHWLPECLGGPSSSKGSGHSQGGVPPLGQIAHSDWSKEGLQLIGPLALSQDNSEGDSALPPFLRPVLLCFPAFR